jgi:seryl-tRNA(Sec) selenium transferase
MCRTTIVSCNNQRGALDEEIDHLTGNIYLLMDEETQYYNSIAFLENEKQELEEDIFKLKSFKRDPEGEMKKYMEKRKEQFKNMKTDIEMKKKSVVKQLDGYNMLYCNLENNNFNYKQALIQIQYENENTIVDTELEEIIELDLEPIEFEYTTPTQRNDMQSPPPLLRMRPQT